MSDILEGRCLCGAVKIRVKGGHDPRAGACHCRMCQRWTGGVFLCFEAAAEAVTVEGPVSRYQSTAFAERAFCSTCGSHLWMRDVDSEAGAYELMPGLFDTAREWPLRSEIYADRAMAAVRLEGSHQRITRDAYEAQNPFIDGDV